MRPHPPPAPSLVTAPVLSEPATNPLAAADCPNSLDHPIFSESIRLIRAALEPEAALQGLSPIQQDVVLRLVHSSGDLSLVPAVRFSPGACEQGAQALASGAVILTDTAMAAAAVQPMARRCFGNAVRSVLDWAPERAPQGSTRTAAGGLVPDSDKTGAVTGVRAGGGVSAPAPPEFCTGCTEFRRESRTPCTHGSRWG